VVFGVVIVVVIVVVNDDDDHDDDDDGGGGDVVGTAADQSVNVNGSYQHDDFMYLPLSYSFR